MSQDPYHFKTDFQSRTECENRRQGHTNHPSAFCLGELSADSVVSSSSRASSSSTGEAQLRQTGLRGRMFDYFYDPGQDIPSDTALCLFDGTGPQTINIGLHRERFDHPSCLIPGAPEQETDTKDGQQIRWHRATERPLPSSPALNAPTSPHSRLEPGRDLGTSSHPAHQVSNSSHNKQHDQAAGRRQSGFLTSQKSQERQPTATGPGSTKEITHRLNKTTLPMEPIVRAEQKSDSNASTLVAETRFDPIAELEDFDGIPLMRGEGYHHPSTLRRNSIPPSDGLGFGAAADKGVQREETLTEETLAGTVRAHVLASGDVARARRGYQGSTSRPFNCDEDDSQLRMCHDIVPDFTPVPAFEEYRIPAFPWQRHPSRRYEETSMGLRQLMVSLCESLHEKNW